MDPNSQQQPYQPPASTTPPPAKGGGSGFGFNIKRYVGTVIHYWYWFVLSLLLALIIAYIYLLIAKPVYLIKGSLLVDKEEQVVQSDILSKLDMGGKKETTIDLYNEINLLRSEDLVQQAVDSLNLNVTY
jgi:tyrosine-protein kinase Etk/Wzc